MIRIDTNKIDKWDEIQKNQVEYFKCCVESELSNLYVDKNKYTKKRRKNNSDEFEYYYYLDKKDRNKIEELFGGVFSTKKEKSIFRVSNEENLNTIICGQIKDIINLFEKYKLNDKLIRRIFNYDKFCKEDKEWNRHKFISKMNIKVCPYCNRQYITNYYNAKYSKIKATADLDHYLSQKKYPYLALSLFNLIPCCQICNSRFKLDKDFKNNPHIYPYEEKFGDNAIFRITGETIESLLGENDEFEIYFDVKELNIDKKEKIYNSIKTFHLDELYNNHKDYVREMIKKSIIYSDDKIKELLQDFPGLFDSNYELERIIFGNYIGKDELGKRPLSKLTKDILEDLGLKFE